MRVYTLLEIEKTELVRLRTAAEDADKLQIRAHLAYSIFIRDAAKAQPRESVELSSDDSHIVVTPAPFTAGAF